MNLKSPRTPGWKIAISQFLLGLGIVFPALALVKDGIIYSTKPSGGTNGGGILFSMNADGTHYTVLHKFGIPAGFDGVSPQGTLSFGTDGTLYGTTLYGATNNAGTAFKIRNHRTG